jgi:putative radical SAM enzyme (TIGR03279 family)
VGVNGGVSIEGVREGSAAYKAGIRKGDALISINGHRIRDIIDYMFYKSAPRMEVELKRDSLRKTVGLELKEGEDAGIELRHFKVKTCKNNCIFCFVSQLPKGLRKSLYVKDEDYRMSFLYGNYVTLADLSPNDRQRIISQRLSPLYISVHSTDPSIRRKMLGNPKAPDILKEIGFLSKNRIRMHVQIVLCPGMNDGKSLDRTIRDLYGFYPYVSSIAVVPVGLTKYGGKRLRPVEREDAASAIKTIENHRKRYKKKHGDPIVYGSDELYIKAEMPIPPIDEYGELPQIENGVGMVADFISEAKKIKQTPETTQKYITFTGASFYPYLRKFIDRLRKAGIDIEALPVENIFFGSTVTVAGLLTGRDVVNALSDKVGGKDMLLIPDAVMRDGKDVFLDDISCDDIKKAVGINAKVIGATPKGLIDALKEA